MSTQAAVMKRKLKRKEAKLASASAVASESSSAVRACANDTASASVTDKIDGTANPLIPKTDTPLEKKGAGDKVDIKNSVEATRLSIAKLCLKEVKNLIPLGSTNTLKESDYISINNFLMNDPTLPIYRYGIKAPSKNEDLKLIREAITESIERLKASGKSLPYPLEEKPTKACIATILYGVLLQTQLDWLFPAPAKNLKELIELHLRTSAIAKFFKVGNCRFQRSVALEYLLKHHGDMKDIFPLHVVEVPGQNDTHCILLMGDFPTDKEVYTLKSLIPLIKNPKECLVVDPWVDKVFPILEWNQNAAKEYCKEDVAFRRTGTINNLKQFNSVAKSFNVDIGKGLGTSPAELEGWRTELYKICSGAYKKDLSLNSSSFFISGLAQALSARDPNRTFRFVSTIGGQVQEGFVGAPVPPAGVSQSQNHATEAGGNKITPA